MTTLGTMTARDDGFSMERLTEAIHYVCSNVTASDRLGSVKLNKILYYADMLHYAETSKSITGATYVKRPQGPAPKQLMPAIRRLEEDDRLDYRKISMFDVTRTEFTPKGGTQRSIFSVDEVVRLSQMINFVSAHSAQQISDFSHTIVWEAAGMAEELPYESFLVSYLDEPSEGAISRSVEAVSRIEREMEEVYD